MPMHYAGASPDELLAALEQAGHTPEKELLEACLAHPDALTPRLLDWLKTGSAQGDRENWEDDDPRWYRNVHAGRLLIAYREPHALPLLTDIVRDEDRDHLLDWFDAHLLAHYGAEAIAPFARIARDPEVWLWGRSHAVGVLETIAHKNPETRDEVLGLLRSLLPEVNAGGQLRKPLPFDEDQAIFYASVASSLANLDDRTSVPQVRALYRIGMIDETWMGEEADYLQSLDDPPHLLPDFDLIQLYHPSRQSQMDDEAALRRLEDEWQNPYLDKSDADLFAELDEAGYAPHPQLIAAFLHREATVRPGLRERLVPVGTPNWREDDPRWYRPVHAAVLLTEMQDEAALPAIETLLHGDDGFLLDWLSPHLSASYGAKALPMFTRLLHDETLEPSLRAGYLFQITLVAAYHPETRADVLGLLRGELPALDEELPAASTKPQRRYWGTALMTLALLNDTDADAQARTLYASNRIASADIPTYEDWLDVVSEEHDLRAPMRDLVFEYGHRYRIEREARQEQQRKQRNALQFLSGDGDTRGTFMSGEKVGRNDPCPCGSGKKYKKCCGKP